MSSGSGSVFPVTSAGDGGSQPTNWRPLRPQSGRDGRDRRLVEGLELDPTRIPNQSFVSQFDFADNALLQKLRDEYRAAHPHYSYKSSKDGHVRSTVTLVC